jgi:predicted  nucleic acid-binding Zn-ribbon protein
MINDVRLLQELQELDIILREAAIVHGEDDKTVPVEQKREDLRKQIDVDVLARYDRLIRNGLAVVGERSGMCMGCNIGIPVGDMNRIRSQKQEPICPNCGVFLAV